MKTSRSEFHTIRNLRYHVRTWGERAAPRLFLLHGWMDVAASFQFLVDALAREWHVVAPDWRGFGLTEWARDGYWFPDYYADLDALLDIYERDAPVRLVGHSMGGNIAVTYAGLRPDRIERLVTLEGLGLARSGAERAPERLVQWMDAQREPPRFRTYASFDAVAQRLKKNNPRLSDERAQFLARHWAAEVEGGVRLVSDPRHKSANPYLFRIEEALACWRRVSAPVLLVMGRDSQIVAWLKDHPAELAERKAAFAAFREVELADCGHMIHHDQPAQAARLIEDFLAAEGAAT
ncbi:MAG TPA: alpha/beta hydrolase [Burkholderiales bacterium]|nr:alpha/beta hydrolase [Burkholderiales bacterium]